MYSSFLHHKYIIKRLINREKKHLRYCHATLFHSHFYQLIVYLKIHVNGITKNTISFEEIPLSNGHTLTFSQHAADIPSIFSDRKIPQLTLPSLSNVFIISAAKKNIIVDTQHYGKGILELSSTQGAL